jgi:TRAP-type C4-dicarboxylate transport system substrate-binding protein
MNVPFGEIYTALERGLMDGMVSGDLTGMSMGFFENAPYLNLWPFTEVFPLSIMMNRDAFEALSPELQTQVMNSLQASRDHIVTNLIPVVKERTYSLIAEKGVTVIEPSEAELAKARELSRPILEAWVAEDPNHLELVRLLEQATGRTIL